MTNPIKRFFQILKAIILFPVSFLQLRKVYQDIDKLRRLPEDPEEMRKLLAEMGLEDEMMPLLAPMMGAEFRNQQINEVDLSYLDDGFEEDDDEENKVDD